MKQKQEEKTRLCPFKKIIERDYNGHSGKSTINERFAPCAGERCMAYISHGFYSAGCARLESEKK